VFKRKLKLKEEGYKMTEATKNFIENNKSKNIKELLIIARSEKEQVTYEDIDIIEEYNKIIEELSQMTGYEDFVNNPIFPFGIIARLWELKVNGTIENLIDFYREFLRQKGFIYTGYNKDYKAIFNNKWVFDGLIQEGNKIALRIVQI